MFFHYWNVGLINVKILWKYEKNALHSTQAPKEILTCSCLKVQFKKSLLSFRPDDGLGAFDISNFWLCNRPKLEILKVFISRLQRYRNYKISLHNVVTTCLMYTITKKCLKQ